MNPLITLSIPIYNVENYVEKSLGSALNQTYDNLEILVIDDKGTDNSMEVVRNIIVNHPRGHIVKIIEHDKNQGLGATRNTSIDNAKGEYLFFMDSDDEITPDCISTLYAAMKETPVDFVVGSIDEVDDSGCIVLSRKYIDTHLNSNEEILNSQFNHKWQKSRKSSLLIAPIWNKLYDLEFIRKNEMRCIPYQKNEDLVFSFKLFLKANSCKILSIPTYRYNIARTGSTTNEARKGYTEFRLRQDLDILEFYSSFIDEIKINHPETSKYVLRSIIGFGRKLKSKLSELKMSSKDYYSTVERIQKAEDIKITDLPLNIGSVGSWIYVFGPNWICKLIDKFYFDKKQS